MLRAANKSLKQENLQLAVFTAFNILANYKFPLNEALAGNLIFRLVYDYCLTANALYKQKINDSKRSNMKKLNLVLGCLLTIFPPLSFAAVIDCGSNDIERIMVHGDREGSHAHENKLIVHLTNNGENVFCSSGANYVYIENTSSAYNGILSTMLAAQASGKKIDVAINTTVTAGNAVQIAWITLSK